MRLTPIVATSAIAALAVALTASCDSRGSDSQTASSGLSAAITGCYNLADEHGSHTHADFDITNSSDHVLSVASVVVTVDGAPIKGTTLARGADLNAAFAAGVWEISAAHPLVLQPGQTFKGSQPGYSATSLPAQPSCSISVR